MTFLYYVPVVLIVLLYSLYYYFTRTFNYWKKRNVPYPKPVPFFGNLKESTLRKKNIGVVISDIYDQYPNEKVVGLYRMTTPCLLIRDLELIKYIMIKDFDLFADRGVEFSKEGLGQNLFHADGETWRALRSRFSPIFTSGKLKNMFPLMNNRAEHFMKYLSSETKIVSEFHINSLTQMFTMSSISACAFGIDIDPLKDNMDEFREIDRLTFTPNFAQELDMMYPGLLKKLNLSLLPKMLTRFFGTLARDIITQRGGKPTNRNDFMDLILELRQMGEVSSAKFGLKNKPIEITEGVIAAQAFVFYVAGYETSSTTSSHMLYQIALNPHVQDKLIAEIDEVTKLHDGKITYDALKDMKYLRKTFDETLRMYSIVEPLQRQALVDYKLPGTDVVVEKGQIVLVSPRGIHYDPKYYPNPHVFDPERFEPDVAGARHPCAYMPFGIGQRNCIGMRFGRLQSELFIAQLLSKFRVEPCKKTMLNYVVHPNKVIIAPEGGIYLNIVPRS